MRIDEADTRGQEENAVAEVADEDEVVGRGRLRSVADLALADAAERFVEARRFRRLPWRECLGMAPQRTREINAANIEAMEKIE